MTPSEVSPETRRLYAATRNRLSEITYGNKAIVGTGTNLSYTSTSSTNEFNVLTECSECRHPTGEHTAADGSCLKCDCEQYVSPVLGSPYRPGGVVDFALTDADEKEWQERNQTNANHHDHLHVSFKSDGYAAGTAGWQITGDNDD